MIIVADSSALVALALSDGLELLDQLYKDVRVPKAVYYECTKTNKAGAEQLEKYLNNKVSDVDLSNFILSSGGLGLGELEAMALYKHLNAGTLLIDDRRAKKVASLNSIQVIGSLGVFILAKERKLILAVKPYLTKIQESKIFLSDNIVEEVLRLTNEE